MNSAAKHRILSSHLFPVLVLVPIYVVAAIHLAAATLAAESLTPTLAAIPPTQLHRRGLRPLTAAKDPSPSDGHGRKPPRFARSFAERPDYRPTAPPSAPKSVIAGSQGGSGSADTADTSVDLGPEENGDFAS